MTQDRHAMYRSDESGQQRTSGRLQATRAVSGGSAIAAVGAGSAPSTSTSGTWTLGVSAEETLALSAARARDGWISAMGAGSISTMVSTGVVVDVATSVGVLRASPMAGIGLANVGVAGAELRSAARER